MNCMRASFCSLRSHLYWTWKHICVCWFWLIVEHSFLKYGFDLQSLGNQRYSSIDYKNLVKFLASLSKHAIKVTFLKVLPRKITPTHTFMNEEQDHKLSLRSEKESTGLAQAGKFTFEYWSCSLVLIYF